MSSNDPTTNMDDAWISRALAQLPCYAFPADHPSAGSVRTCPVRLSFCHLFTPQAAMEKGRPPKFVTSCLFPYGADLTPLKELATTAAYDKWPLLGQPGQIQVAQLHAPFKDQGEKAQWDGYLPGRPFITASSERRPPVVDQRGAPIVQPDKVYPGVWALVTVRPFAYETRHHETGAVLKRGVSFGLQSVMLLVDDKELGGGGGDPAAEFAGINIEGLAPSMDPQAMFGAPAAQPVYVAPQPGYGPVDPLLAAQGAPGYVAPPVQPAYVAPPAQGRQGF